MVTRVRGRVAAGAVWPVQSAMPVDRAHGRPLSRWRHVPQDRSGAVSPDFVVVAAMVVAGAAIAGISVAASVASPSEEIAVRVAQVSPAPGHGKRPDAPSPAATGATGSWGAPMPGAGGESGTGGGPGGGTAGASAGGASAGGGSTAPGSGSASGGASGGADGGTTGGSSAGGNGSSGGGGSGGGCANADPLLPVPPGC